MSNIICGIDLGTTNSLIAVWQDGTTRIIANALGQNLTPSAVSLDDNDTLLVGQAAKERLSTHPHQTVVNFKRYMGTNKEIKLGKRVFRAEELSALVIRTLIEDAEAALGQKIDEAIVTVPAYFNDAQRKATKIAGELAGIKVERLLNEPTAAAMAYGLHTKDNESQYLILDLGGGTFDVSILEFFDGIMEVHATAGDNFLGGTDFTELLENFLLKQLDLKAANLKAEKLPVEFKKRLYICAEKAKREISQSGKANLNLSWNDHTFEIAVNETEFEKVVAPLLDRVTQPIKMALKDAKLRVSEIDDIVLVGGATRMPAIKKLTTRLFQRFPATGINPDEVVVTGAAIQAGLKARDAMLDDMVLTDVCPYTLGIDVVMGERKISGHYHPIIERNNYIPISRVERFYTADDHQKSITVNVYQGENPLVKDNIFLGKINVGVPSNGAGQESIDVRFTYDINGLLEVLVTVVSTQESHSLIIEENPGVLTKKEIGERLKALETLKIHPRELQENLVLIHRAERLYSELLGKDREDVGYLLAQFNAVLEDQNPRDIEQARKHFALALSQYEGDYQF